MSVFKFIEKRKAGIVSCLFLSFSSIAQNNHDQWQFDHTLSEAYQYSIALQISRSNDLLDSYSNKQHYGWLYLSHINDVIDIFINEDETKFREFEDHTDQRLEKLRNAPESPFKAFYMAEIKLHKSFLHLKFGEELSAAWNFRQAYRLIKKNIKEYPGFIYNKKPAGLQHILIGSAPEKHQWLLNLLGFEGSVDSGLEELQTFSNSNTVYSLETDVLLAFIYSYLMQDHQCGLEIIAKYKDSLQSNLLLNYALTSILIKNSQSEEALRELENFRHKSHIYFPFTDYQKGTILLQKGEYNRSIRAFRKFLSNHNGMNYIKDALYKTGINYWMLDNAARTNEFFSQAEARGQSLTEADKYAVHALNQPLSDKNILKLRLFTDGGYYDEARLTVSKIKGTSFANEKDRVEFNYRQARLYDKTGKTLQAIGLYKNTILESGDKGWYFAPNSALQLGYYYETGDNLQKAKEYFELALSYKNHPYKNSIDNKAKAALARLKDK